MFSFLILLISCNKVSNHLQKENAEKKILIEKINNWLAKTNNQAKLTELQTSIQSLTENLDFNNMWIGCVQLISATLPF